MNQPWTPYYGGANERILSRVPASATRVLDIGCAEGRLGKQLKSLRADREVWGIELSSEAAAIAKGRLDHVLTGDVERMNPIAVPKKYFDCIVCGDVLEHLKEPAEVLRRLGPLLIAGGCLIAQVPNVAHWSVILQLLQGEFEYQDADLLDRTHLRFFTPSSFRDLLWESGFIIIDEDAISQPEAPGAQALASGAAFIGMDPQRTLDAVSVYQQLYVAKPAPRPNEQPDKLSLIRGPHVRALGAATKRCSVVVLTYNSADVIEDCIRSVIPTLGPEDELILVDNGSEDDTERALQSFADRDPRVTVIANGQNLGYSKGCNVGLLRSSGANIILLNPDTIVQPLWIEELITPFEDPQVAAVGPLSDNVCGDQHIGLHIGAGGYEPANLPPFPTKLLVGFCLALRRSSLDELGLLEEACFLGADDLEVSWRLRELGFELVVNPRVFVQHRCGVSFATITPEQKRELVWESDLGLIRKMRAYYETDILPTSRQVWGNEIFKDAMRLARSQGYGNPHDQLGATH